MQKVISINLNGNAYHVEEGGYDALVAYLDGADRQLRDNPDRAEIVADLEQAIAEKCQRYLTAHKTVIAAGEVAAILKEMGPVDGADTSTDPKTGSSGSPHSEADAPRRLYRIADGEMIAGVCNGIAAYFRVDPTIVRIVFVGLLFLTRGGFAIVYIVLAFVVPQANTSEERAAARGQPFNARELIDRAKKHAAGYARRRDWRFWRRDAVASSRARRASMREARRAWRDSARAWRWGGPYGPPAAVGYGTRVAAGLMVPVLTLLSVALFWLMLFAIFSLVTQADVFGVVLPDDVPLWVGIVIVVLVYQAVAWPLHMLRRSSYYVIGGPYGTVAALDGLLSLAFVVAGIWLAFRYLPEVHELLQTLPDVARSLRDTLQN
jgi:phage shock protein PspC (stress-responsive transcriptional regulator)